jgi:hypothetical protein
MIPSLRGFNKDALRADHSNLMLCRSFIHSFSARGQLYDGQTVGTAKKLELGEKN